MHASFMKLKNYPGWNNLRDFKRQILTNKGDLFPRYCDVLKKKNLIQTSNLLYKIIIVTL